MQRHARKAIVAVTVTISAAQSTACAQQVEKIVRIYFEAKNEHWEGEQLQEVVEILLAWTNVLGCWLWAITLTLTRNNVLFCSLLIWPGDHRW